jgi:thymidylate synthase ThyX
MACLSGDSILDFDIGGTTRGNVPNRYGRHKLTVEEVYNRWMFGGFGNRREDYDLSFIQPEEYYTAFNIGSWFINRKFIADSLGINKKMKSKNRKITNHYKGSDIISFYEQQKIEGKNIHKDILKRMDLRSLNEDTGEVYHTRITNIWKTGQKPVYKICVGNQETHHREIKASEDHLFFTETGWKKLKDIGVGDKVWTAASHPSNLLYHQEPQIGNDEIWIPCYRYENEYLVSSYGRVKRIGKARSAKVGLIKQPTLRGDRYVIGLSKKGKTSTWNIHRLVLISFMGEPNDPIKNMCCHKNGNPLDNRVENLYWGSAQNNANDSIEHGTRTSLKGRLVEVKSITFVGIEDTYDIEVEGPYHNFAANSFIVHNSINEYSGRYSVMSNEFYLPEADRMQGQSTDNKQMSSGQLDWEYANEIDGVLRDSYQHAYSSYDRCLDLGLSRELARIQLPLSNYTELYWKINLHNFFHYIGLRDDPSHAQFEIAELARIMYQMVKKVVPASCQAFEDYRKNAMTFSALELEALVEMFDDEFYKEGIVQTFIEECQFRLRGKEVTEFIHKIQSLLRGRSND